MQAAGVVDEDDLLVDFVDANLMKALVSVRRSSIIFVELIALQKYRRKLGLARRTERAPACSAGDIVLSKSEVVGYSVQGPLYSHAFTADNACQNC